MKDQTQTDQLLQFCENVAKGAGKMILQQKEVRTVVNKKGQDIATNADLESERYILDRINSKYPDHSIFSEERGRDEKDPDYLWIIDPLDATKDFVRNIPYYNVAIAVSYKDRLIASSVHLPAQDRTYSAGKGSGAFLDESPIQVSDTNVLRDAFVYCYMPNYHRNKQNYNRAWRILSELGKQAYRIRSLSCINLGLCWLAHGGCDAYIDLSNPPKQHDIAPGLLIAEEAGAVICDTKGNELPENKESTFIATNNTGLKAQILEIVLSAK